MKVATIEDFLAADDPKRCESSKSFDRRMELDRVEEARRQLEKVTGKKFVLESRIEDASFFADLIWPTEVKWLIRIRFFGVWRSCDDFPQSA